MRTVILGITGQLGTELSRRLPDAIGLSRRELDLAQTTDIRPILAPLQPECLINCAAYTQVDRAEAEPELAFRVNAEGPARLAEFCREQGTRLIHISTDFVFGGESFPDRPRVETDPAVPLSVYGASKLEGERRIQALLPDALILRTCGLYGPGGTGNFVRTMLRLASEKRTIRVVQDQTCSPTSVRDLATALLELRQAKATGLFHVVNRGGLSWYDFARLIFETAGLQADLQPITSAEFQAAAPRPRYSVLDPTRCEQLLGRPLPNIPTALTQFLHK